MRCGHFYRCQHHLLCDGMRAFSCSGIMRWCFFFILRDVISMILSWQSFFGRLNNCLRWHAKTSPGLTSTLGGGSSTLGDCALCLATLGDCALVLLGSRIACSLLCFSFCSHAFHFATISKSSATFYNASISSLSLVKFPFIACVNICAAATTLSSSVTFGFVKYLCLKNTVSVTLYALVFLIHTVKHL